MSNDNGTAFTESSASNDQTQAIAQSILGTLRGTTQKTQRPPVPSPE